jgi:hypothetical protein
MKLFVMHAGANNLATPSPPGTNPTFGGEQRYASKHNHFLLVKIIPFLVQQNVGLVLFTTPVKSSPTDGRFCLRDRIQQNVPLFGAIVYSAFWYHTAQTLEWTLLFNRDSPDLTDGIGIFERCSRHHSGLFFVMTRYNTGRKDTDVVGRGHILSLMK